MSDDIPEWAKQRARALVETEPSQTHFHAFARYIAQHEQPPRDKLREVAEKVWGVYANEGPYGVDGMIYAIRAHLPQAALDAIEASDD